MPVRRETTRAKRLNDRTIESLRELIRQGHPWNVDDRFRQEEGINELRGLVSGHFFFTDLCGEDNDEETKRFLYEAIKDELVSTHAHFRPASRPWSWWEFDAPELRHVVGRHCVDPTHDDDCDGDHETDRLPAADDPDLPPWAKGKMYFGAPAVYDGHCYESSYEYLARLNLLFPEEKAIFEKYDAIINVHVQHGDRGKCQPCWARAREVAKKIDFDLDAAIQRFEFWIPGDLYFECEHQQYHDGADGIFSEVDCP